MGMATKMTTFAEALHGARRNAKISQRSLAEQCGVDFSYISKIEHGHVPPPSTKTIIRMAHVLEVDAVSLLVIAHKVPVNLNKPP
jgi:transcriptional regulator with XRE-family HTH domain